MRHGSVDLLKHLFALAVVFMHMSSKTRYSQEVNNFILECQHYVDGAVLGFFMIAGFFIKPGRLNSFGDFLSSSKTLLFRLGAPYLLFSIVYAIGTSLLGKGNLVEALRHTFLLHGSSMQLYFLPYLFLVACTFLFVVIAARRRVAPIYSATLIMVCSLAIALTLPTRFSAGSGWALLPLYSGSYSVGFILAEQTRKGLQSLIISGAVLSAIMLIAGTQDFRFYDVSLVMVLLVVAVVLSLLRYIPQRTFPGSGGVFLLHTPIINFAISAALMYFGVIEYANLFLSMLITYVVCVLLTRLYIYCFENHRYLLLE